MGATKSTQNVQVRTLTGDGLTGFWSYRRDNSTDFLKGLVYNGKNAIVKSADKLDWEETFYEAVFDFRNDDLPTVDQGTNANRGAPSEQFEDPLLTDSELGNIAVWFDAQDFCEKMGTLLLVKRFFAKSNITWSNSSDIYIYLGQTGKGFKEEVEPELDWLLYNSHITQNQYDTFWTDWETQVEGT